jgi:uncharacterized membrane protein YkoI
MSMSSTGGWRIRAGIALVALLLSPLAAAGDHEDDHERVHRLMRSGVILPLEKIIERQRATHHGRVLEAELEDSDGGYIYELEWLDDNGEVTKRRFDATTGEPLDPIGQPGAHDDGSRD